MMQVHQEVTKEPITGVTIMMMLIFGNESGGVFWNTSCWKYKIGTFSGIFWNVLLIKLNLSIIICTQNLLYDFLFRNSELEIWKMMKETSVITMKLFQIVISINGNFQIITLRLQKMDIYIISGASQTTLHPKYYEQQEFPSCLISQQDYKHFLRNSNIYSQWPFHIPENAKQLVQHLLTTQQNQQEIIQLHIM